MKVLIVHPKVPIYGGAEKAIVRLCDYMRGHNIAHALVMPQLPNGMKADLKDTKVYGHMPIHGGWDIINYHNFPATLESLFGAHSSNVKEVWMLNEPPEMFTNWKRKPVEWVNRKLVKHKIKNVIVNDKFNAGRCFDLYDVIPEVVYPGVDYEFFNQAEDHPNPEFFTVLQVGTISRYKNQLASIEAVAGASKWIPNIRLWLMGYPTEPEYKSECLQRIEELGVKVNWFSNKSMGDLRRLYSQADVLIHPIKPQGGWLVPFEALSAGTPIIVSDELTCSDVVRQNHLGTVAYQAADYVAALRQLSKDGEACRSEVEHAREWISHNLTWEIHGERTIRYFGRLLASE